MRRTKLICTIGPKTENFETMKMLAKNGMNIARINMSHGTKEWHSKIFERIKKLGDNSRFPLGIMLDTQGPEIRTSADTEFGLEEGDIFKIAVSSACDIQEGEKHTYINQQNLIEKVKEGSTILIDDGMIALEVLKIEPYHVTCKVLNKGNLGTRKSVNIPGIKLDLPAVTNKDKEDLSMGVKHGVDFIAQSFVRKREDVVEMRKFLSSLNSDAMIIAKIEDQEGIDNIDDIIRESDGIMVARGDLGVELPYEQIPIIQKQIVKKCISKGKPVIISTHLLESMINFPRPTRAEVTDVANAIFEKADCVMLSAETTKGNYPVECVEVIHNIAKNVQSKLKFEVTGSLKTHDPKEAITLGACINAENLDARAIVVFTKTGRLLSMVTKHRPNVEVFAFTEKESIMRKLMLYWNTFAFKTDFNSTFEEVARGALDILKNKELVNPGDRLILVSDVNPKKNIDTMEIRQVD